MLKDIVDASVTGNHSLRIRFEDGVEGIVDLGSQLSFRGVFAPLREPGCFAQVQVDPELGTVVWPNGADLDPDVLYGRITGVPATMTIEPAATFSGPGVPQPCR